MNRPRRAASTRGKKGDAGDAPPTKKIKVETRPTIDNRVVRFEWEGDKSKWVRYTKKFNKIIVDAYNAGKNEVELTVPNGMIMVVIFDKMVQKNKKTGFERRIRVAIKEENMSLLNEFNVYEWQDEAKKWVPYSVPISLQLEQAYQADQDVVTLKTPPNTYDVSLKKLTQTNKKSKFSRAIRRGPQESDVPPDDDDEEEEAKNGSASAVKEEEEEEEEVKPKSGKGRGKGSSGKGKSSAEGTKSAVRTVVVEKGAAPVDAECPIASKSKVYKNGKVVWDCMLNQTNIANNNNKYYLIQLLQETGNGNLHVWQRWGRVGYKGQCNLFHCGSDLNQAMQIFTKKFRDKTGNDWSLKDSFTKVAGKYDLLKMDYSADGEEDKVDGPAKKPDEPKEEEDVPDSKLDKKLQDLVQMICDVKSMEDAVIEMKYDAKKNPLGKLTKDQIKAGYTALKKIEGLIQKKDMGPNLQQACSDFYTRIPHEFGMQTPPLIRTPQEVKKKIELLEALEDIEIAIKMLKGGDKSENPIDRHYHQLHCGLDTIKHDSEDFKLVNKYLQQTHASTHGLYRMELVDVFACEKEGEKENFIDYGNRQLLWHGSRLTNWAGILGKGLRIAPPEAPSTGYMFDKGVYFADVSSKSANYCFPSKTRDIGLLVLCDVSLGVTNDKLAADYQASNLPAGKHSVRGLGSVAPDPKDTVTLPDGLVVPLGKPKNVTNIGRTALNYNEFIVYDTKQIRMKYLLKIKFHFK